MIQKLAAAQQSYPAAVILQQVHLHGLQAAVVTACVDLGHETEAHRWISRLIGVVERRELDSALTMFWWMAMHITMSLWPP